MATIAATNSATPSVQAQLLQSRIAQARREADQAESRARDLRSQADEEQRKADQGHNEARQLTAQQGRTPVARARATDPTYLSAVRPPAGETPAHAENPQALQTVTIAKSLSSLGAALFSSGTGQASSGRLLSATA